MIPTFVRQLLDPAVRRILLCGCGGGFDFVHGLLLYAGLREHAEEIVLGSYSFGDPDDLGDPDDEVFRDGQAVVRYVHGTSRHPDRYAPEVHVCSYLDHAFPDSSPHGIYAYNARSFTPRQLRRFYERLVERHRLDAVVLVDGGTDSLMSGDEAGLGDPIEDAVSVQAVADLDPQLVKLLLCIGLGVDRYNGVSDASALRAVAELAQCGGFRGVLGIESSDEGYRLYRDALAWIEERQSFRSVVASAIRRAVEGGFGPSPPLGDAAGGSAPSLFLWPLMAMIWAFDPGAVVGRSRLHGPLQAADSVADCYASLRALRHALGDARRGPESLPAPAAWPLAPWFDRDADPPA